MAGKVLFFHYRVGKTDGVSLEMANWKQILESRGWNVLMCAGPVSEGADFVVENFEAQLNPVVFRMDEEAFGGFKDIDFAAFEAEFKQVQSGLETEFTQVLNRAKPDRILVSNVWSVGENVAAAGALARAIDKTGVATTAVHHDFWWENIRYRKPSCDLITTELEEYFPPLKPWLRHAVINLIARRSLSRRKGVVAEVLHDCVDFGQPNKDTGGVCGRMLAAHGVTSEDLVVLQATRIVRRKNIEISMDLVSRLMPRVGEMGKKRVVLVMAGYAEKRDEWYLALLRKYAQSLGIHTVELNGLANHYSQTSGEKCDLLGVYPYAAVVTYPSQYEGFGNQFLEAVYAKKPIVVYEYPVYKTDIKPLGFEVISLGDGLTFDPKTNLAQVPTAVLDRAVDQVVQVMQSPETNQRMTDKNFALGEANFSFAKTGELLERLLA